MATLKSTTFAFIDEQNGSGGIEEYSVDASARYLRILGTQRGTGYGYSLWEVQVYQCGLRDLEAFSALAAYWLESDCGSNNDCSGMDKDLDGDVDLTDLQEFLNLWLSPDCSGV